MSKPRRSEWLSLKHAAGYLGVHPTTLRRWADAGELPVLLTPGGHRRFARDDLARFAEARCRLKTVVGLEQIWSQEALAQARHKIDGQRHAPWLAAFDEAEREHKRELGRRLVAVLLRYITSPGGEVLLEEARVIGREHAEHTLALGMPLVDAMRALLFFRDAVVEAALDLPEMAGVRPDANLLLLRRVNRALNEVQLALADVYDRAAPSRTGRRVNYALPNVP